MKAETERKHALLSASGAARWLACPPSARLEETMPEQPSEYADEGRLAHEIAELKVRKAFVEPMGVRKFNNRIKKFRENPLFQDEMLKHTDVYLDYIMSETMRYATTPYVAVEKRVDFSRCVPEGFGTADCVICGNGTLQVIDLKYGKGVPVSADHNPQMMLYALGAYTDCCLLFPIELIKMTIVQPRLDVISEFSMFPSDLISWAESTVKPTAVKAFAGEGEYVSGDHCRFCRAKSLCRARAEFNTAIEDEYPKKPPIISSSEVGELLTKARDLKHWIKDLEEFALSECLAGREIPGWKAVEGRSTRAFTDQEAAFNVLLAHDVEEAILYERKPLTLAAAEKVVGKTKFNDLLADYIIKPPGKPTLVVEGDKRPAITNQITAEQAFGNEEKGETHE